MTRLNPIPSPQGHAGHLAASIHCRLLAALYSVRMPLVPAVARHSGGGVSAMEAPHHPRAWVKALLLPELAGGFGLRRFSGGDV